MDENLREQLKKQFEIRLKNIETNLKNQQPNNKQKEPQKTKVKEIIKKNDQFGKDSKNINQNKENIVKSTSNSIQNKINEFNNNINIKNSYNKKSTNNNIKINTNNINNSILREQIQNSLNKRKSFKEKETPKSTKNLNNNHDITRISTPAPYKEYQSPKMIENNNIINNKKNTINNKNNISNKNVNKVPIKSKEIKNYQMNKNFEEKRSKSLINNQNRILKQIILNDISRNELKKTNSTKNKNIKIDLMNKRVKPEKNIYDDDIDEIMKIDDFAQGRETKEKKIPLPQGYKRANTQNKKNPVKEKIPAKKRHSVLDENNCLTIKLKSKNNYTKDDFEVVTFSGRGAYGTVLQVYLKNDPKKKLYAIKKLDINSLFSVNRLYQAYLENDILNELDSPYIVKVYGAFEADGKIHLIMDYLSNGDLSYFIKANFPLQDDIIRFYSAEIVLFLEYMQNHKLVHRDLKPQNIMIDEKGHLKVIDFGTVRKLGYYYDKKEMRFKLEKAFEILDLEDIKGVKNIINPDEEDADEDDYFDDDEEEEEEENEETNGNDMSEKKKRRIQKVRVKRSMTFVGTAEYISPEVIADKPAEFGTDIWAFGVMLYQMYYNTTPFKAMTAYLTFRNIEKPQITFPSDVAPESAKDLIKKILVAEPKMRLGGGDPGSDYDLAHLKKHAFFKNIKWNNLHNSIPPGIKEYKFYECKKKSIYKEQNSGDNQPNAYESLNDKIVERNNNAKIIKEGYIKKKSTWFHYEKRRIILDTAPRIILKSINNIENYYKEIRLNKQCKVKLVENNCFDLKTPIKTYRFKGTENDGNDWAGIIADAITAYAQD